jgi:hypothetical protein
MDHSYYSALVFTHCHHHGFCPVAPVPPAEIRQARVPGRKTRRFAPRARVGYISTWIYAPAMHSFMWRMGRGHCWAIVKDFVTVFHFLAVCGCVCGVKNNQRFCVLSVDPFSHSYSLCLVVVFSSLFFFATVIIKTKSPWQH